MEIRLGGKKNICDEIADEYEKLIRYGALRKGEKLPSCRALASDLGINPNTVERAFFELEKRGLVRTIPKKGVFACAVFEKSHAEEEAKRQLLHMKEAGLDLEQIVSLAKEVFEEQKDEEKKDDRN